jgi:medium-chain acyl-[acyl-carrier-protein] hydrolase
MSTSTIEQFSSVARPNAGKWLAFYKPSDRAALRLFCFPYAGGSATIFQKWRDLLPSEIEVCPIQLPGRGTRLSEPAATHIEPLLPTLAAALSPFLDMPYALFGHSMGGLISFELAKYLRRQSAPLPQQIFVSGRAAPQIPRRYELTYNLPEDEFIAELRRLKGTPQDILEQQELITMLLPLLRADFSLCETYQYQASPPLDCPITALGGLYDKDVTATDLEGWREQTSGTFIKRMFPGDHFFIQSEQKLLLDVLSRDLHKLALAARVSSSARY